MTSQQVLLTLALLLVAGCSTSPRVAEPLPSPYEQRMVWAVVPLRNESGSLGANGMRIADQLAGQLEEAANIDVLPVNRTIAAMNALQMSDVTNSLQAMAILELLKADAVVVGTVSAYDPYDPPKLGMAIELYVSPKHLHGRTAAFDVRRLSRAPRDDISLPNAHVTGDLTGQPVSTVSAYFDSASPRVRDMLKHYAHERSGTDGDSFAWVRYRSSMNLYSEFASYVISWRLLRAEKRRLVKLALIEETADLRRVSHDISAP